jgi:hypothetical protein
MVMLPILFWCGYTSLGRGLVHILASGVFFTGFLKDMFSLPRPLSPPLHRITMSGSAALEYGFPSTHSANAVSVAVYALFTLHDPSNTLSPKVKLFWEVLSYGYMFSIVLGRLYCGMHGFLDVVIGSILGATISLIEVTYMPTIDDWLHDGGWQSMLIVAAIIIILVRIHPEPADDCPCFDDSVAFAGVMLGFEAGNIHYARSAHSWIDPVRATVPFDLSHLGWAKALLRIIIGVATIFAWREIAKPTMLKSLPHVFRVIENYGLVLPRKFFMPASEYKQIPARLRVDNVMPSVSDLPNLITSIRHPGRGRSVSIGPQSAADAYETLAYREKRRRESITDGTGGGVTLTPTHSRGSSKNKISFADQSSDQTSGRGTGMSIGRRLSASLSPAQSRVDSYEQMMGQGHVIVIPPTPLPDDGKQLGQHGHADEDFDLTVGQQNELDEKEMFSRLQKPRVRYDVEVVTKLVVYSGIAWLAVDANPILFELIGLGMGGHR